MKIVPIAAILFLSLVGVISAQSNLPGIKYALYPAWIEGEYSWAKDLCNLPFRIVVSSRSALFAALDHPIIKEGELPLYPASPYDIQILDPRGVPRWRTITMLQRPISGRIRPTFVSGGERIFPIVSLIPFERQISDQKADGVISCRIRLPLYRLNSRSTIFVKIGFAYSTTFDLHMAKGLILKIGASSGALDTQQVGGLPIGANVQKPVEAFFR